MVDKTTPRLGLPVPFLTNPLKIDVGKLTEALTMLDANAVMLTDWDITADGWQKMGTITDLAQGKIALTLMVITGTGFANIVMQTGDGSVTTVGDPARISVTAQTNLGTNEPTILGGKVVETAEDSYEVWFNIAPSTAPRKWSALLAAGNGAKIDWTHTVGAQPAGGVTILIARSLTDQEIASPTVTKNGAVLTAGYAGLMGINLPYYDFAATGDTITSHVWRVGETMRVKAADAISENGFPSGITGAGVVAWRIHCESVNEDRTSMVLIFASEGATPTWIYRITRTNNIWSTPRRMYTSDNPPTASETKAVPQVNAISTVINLNDRILPAHYGVVALTSVAGAVAANNFPFDEPGQLTVFPFGSSGGVTQVYIAKSGRIASRSYDGSVFTTWRKGANSGANDDITSLTNLSGPLKLGGDGIGDYDAVTVRQLKASSGGSGPTMNGIVNNFIGAVEWWNGSPTKLPAGYVLANGQVLSRVAYPEISSAIDKGILMSVTEALWLTDSLSGVSNRAAYSQGGAAGTSPGGVTPDAWFRMPDLNGMQQNSIPNLYLMGWNGVKINNVYSVGAALSQGAPNITGSMKTRVPNGHANEGVGALIGSADIPGMNGNVPVTYGFSQATGPGVTMIDYADPSGYGYSFNAQRGAELYSAAGFSDYRTYGTYTDGALRPNNAVGYWIIRVGGSFQAANTNFSVIAGDTALPSNNTSIKGGQIISDYQVAGVSECKAMLQAVGTVGAAYSARITVTNKTRNNTANFDMSDDGSMNVPGTLTSVGLNVTGASNLRDCRSITFGSGGIINGNIASINGYIDGGYDSSNPKQARGTQLVMRLGTSLTAPKRVELYPLDYQSNYFCAKLYCLKETGGYGWEFRNNDGTLHGNGAYVVDSDIRVKSDIKKVDNALKAVINWRGVTYKRNDVENREVGLIAQDVEPWAPEAVSIGIHTSYDQKTQIKDFKSLNYSGLTAAFHTEAIKQLLDLVDLALTDPESAKATIAALKK